MPEHVRVKICGITRAEDAAVAARCGVDAIGLNFWPGSRRRVDIATARDICAAVPPLVQVVALFVDPAPAEVDAVLAALPVQLLQYHGSEPLAECTRTGRPWIRALRVGGAVDTARLAAQWHGCSGLLLDAAVPGVAGGSGQTFDWSLIRGPTDRVILAGGLGPANVAQAIARVRPAAVDASSGVESAVPGIKDHARIEAFMAEVRRIAD